MQRKILMSCLAVLSFLAQDVYAQLLISGPGDQPHFYLQMANQSNQDVTLSFKQTAGDGKIYLTPDLSDHTPLAAQQQTQAYGVTYVPLGATDEFEIIFTGKQDCAFTVAFFAPGDPKISMAGYGCAGGGYSVSGHTLTLYIANINAK